MRGDKFGSPVLSTYAIGGNATSRPRDGLTRPFGGGLALPVIVILGTASAVAVISVAFEGQTIALVGGGSEAEAPAPLGSTARDPVRTATTGGQSPEASAGQASPATDIRADKLPFLTVLQPPLARPADRPAPQVRPDPPPRRVMMAAPAQMIARADPQPVVSVCLTGCEPGEALEPAEALAELATAEPGPLSAQPAELAGAVPAVDAAPAGAGPIASSAAALEADSGAASELLADGAPRLAVEPIGELVPAAGPSAAPDPQPASVEVALVDPGPEDGDAVVTAPEAPNSQISHHLSRIGERYASASAALPAAPAGDDDGDGGGEGASPEVEADAASVAVAIDGLSRSTVIVQDDELVAITLGELVSLLEDRFDEPLYVWLKSSDVAAKFVTADTLAASGIRTRYDAQRQQLVFTTAGD